jgi:NAD(P)-dependent dehydrogenase (short-subunit alcohol dehydrogenase family)
MEVEKIKMSEEEEKIAVVTGSPSGIGFETSLLLAKNGFHTYATVRNADKAPPHPPLQVLLLLEYLSV